MESGHAAGARSGGQRKAQTMMTTTLLMRTVTEGVEKQKYAGSV
jgi:hypothetical protein